MPRKSDPQDRHTGPAESLTDEVEETSTEEETSHSEERSVQPKSGPSSTSTRTIESRKTQYLIAPKKDRRSGGLAAASSDFNLLAASFDHDPDIEVVKRLSAPGAVSALSHEAGAAEIMVARMSEGKAEALKQHPGAQLIVEEDAELIPEGIPLGPMIRDPGVLVPMTGAMPVALIVIGKDNAPIEGANVYVFGSVFPAQAVTNAEGQAQLQLVGETPTTLRGLYVKPRADYWSCYITNPILDPAQINVVTLTPFEQFPSLAKFPQEEVIGWGQRAMYFDQISPDLRGKGVKVAVVDSGAATSHSDLRTQIKGGFDTIARNDTGWSNDEIAHGSHCAGIIAGSQNGTGIRGIAPEAEVYAFKLFPKGNFSNLLEAIDMCIEKQVDVINLSLGSDQRSELVEQRIQQARQLGIACIVAAGNSGGAVQYPASSMNVLAVAAIGKQGEFPDTSYHVTTIQTGDGGGVTSQGYFSAKFTCFGPEIDVCGPGVAILSSVPPNNYAVWDGTSMAAPHITGLAALILAHHPDFKRTYSARNEKRVERLFQIIRESCQPLELRNPYRMGFGLPDARKALKLQPTSSARPAKVQPSGKPSESVPVPDAEKLKTSLRKLGLAAAAVGPIKTFEEETGAIERGQGESELEKLQSALRRIGVTQGGVAEPFEVKPQGAHMTAPSSNGEGSPLQKFKDSLRKVGISEA